MSHTLTRRNISAIAKLDFSGLSHAQRIEAIAKAIGYETAATLMSTLKASKGAALLTPADPKPVRAVAIFGSSACSAVDSGEKLRDKYGNIEGDVSELTFNTPAELAAYAQGLADADGWMDTLIVADDVDTPNHPFLQAQDADPDLSFADWHDAQVEEEDEDGDDDDGDDEGGEDDDPQAVEDWVQVRMDLNEANTFARDNSMNKERPGRADEAIIGYQVFSSVRNKLWNNRSVNEILDKKQATADLIEAIREDEFNYYLVIIRENDLRG